jgi:hypothetical protein
MNDTEAKIREALKTQRYQPDRVGGRWETIARRYPEIAAIGYETRLRGEHLVDPYPSRPDPERPNISYADERYDALKYGWELRHEEKDRPRDSVDDDLDEAAASQVEEAHQDSAEFDPDADKVAAAVYADVHKKLGARLVINRWSVNCSGPNGEHLFVAFITDMPGSFEDLIRAGFMVMVMSEQEPPNHAELEAMRRYVCDKLGVPYSPDPSWAAMDAPEAVDG